MSQYEGAASRVRARVRARNPYTTMADYKRFRVHVSGKRFHKNPHQLVAQLRAMTSDEVQRRRRALRDFAADVLYDVPGSRVGTHVLTAAMRCRNRSFGAQTGPW